MKITLTMEVWTIPSELELIGFTYNLFLKQKKQEHSHVSMRHPEDYSG